MAGSPRHSRIPRRSDADRRIRQAERLGRVLRLLRLILSPGTWSIARLAHDLECSERTIYRDLQVLTEGGVPWFFDEEQGSYRVRPGFRFPALDPVPSRRSTATSGVPTSFSDLLRLASETSSQMQQDLRTLTAVLRQLDAIPAPSPRPG